ncbi:MAG: DinB family protein [Acidobacteriota bacterium]
MRYLFKGMFLVLLALCTTLPATADGGDDALKAAVTANLEETAKKLIALAEAAPEDMYGWRPTVEVRTLSEVYMHVVSANLMLPGALGAAPPEGVEIGENPIATAKMWEETITSKDEVVAKLKESFAYLTEALGSLEDLDAEVQIFGPPQPKRAYYMILLGHAHEHLGQAISYTRSMGLVPPWSQQAE